MKTYGEACVLENRLCTECGECDCCELNSNKTCDNCCQCIDNQADYVGVEIDEIIMNTEVIKSGQVKKPMKIKR